MAQLIRTNGTRETIKPADSFNGFSLDELYALINCDMIQHVPVGTFGIVIDEEGKLRGQELNAVATRQFRSQLLPGDVLVGNVLVLETAEEFQ